MIEVKNIILLKFPKDFDINKYLSVREQARIIFHEGASIPTNEVLEVLEEIKNL